MNREKQSNQTYNDENSGRPIKGALRAGFAEVDITPPQNLTIAGSFFPREIQGILDPLFAHAMVLESGDRCLALVSCDLLSLRRRMVIDVRCEIEEKFDIPAKNIAIFATHTHTGPFACTIFGHPADEGYVQTLQRKIVEAIGLAFQRLKPAELGIASAFEGAISFNRRYVMKDGLVRTHPPRGSTELSHVEGPMDPEVGVICLRHHNGQVAGYFVNFACHPNVVGGNQISADYPGALSRAIKRQNGEECVTIFGNGACGNICQIDVHDPDKKDTGHDWAERMGKILAQDVASAVKNMTFSPEAKLASVVHTISIPMRDPDKTPYLGTMFSGTPTEQIDQLFSAQQELLRQIINENPNVETEIQTLRIGEAAIAMIPAELFVEFGLDIKLRSPIKPTYVVEQANGTVGYVPTKHAFERGGYEVRTATTSKLVPEAGSMIVGAALDALTELKR